MRLMAAKLFVYLDTTKYLRIKIHKKIRKNAFFTRHAPKTAYHKARLRVFSQYKVQKKLGTSHK